MAIHRSSVKARGWAPCPGHPCSSRSVVPRGCFDSGTRASPVICEHFVLDLLSHLHPIIHLYSSGQGVGLEPSAGHIWKPRLRRGPVSLLWLCNGDMVKLRRDVRCSLSAFCSAEAVSMPPSTHMLYVQSVHLPLHLPGFLV